MNITHNNFEEPLSLYQWHFSSQAGNHFSSEKSTDITYYKKTH